MAPPQRKAAVEMLEKIMEYVKVNQWYYNQQGFKFQVISVTEQMVTAKDAAGNTHYFDAKKTAAYIKAKHIKEV